MFTSWKTTSAGILACVGAVTGVYFAAKNGTLTPEVITTAVAAFLTGIGLIFARDNGVTSEQAGAKPPTQ
jgi:phosphotransferase system  glucose/maltose/N-acetylglucosamine-specific IIC component